MRFMFFALSTRPFLSYCFSMSADQPMQSLTAIIYPDRETDWLVAECPEIGTASQGKTMEEALTNLKEATELYLESFPQARPRPTTITHFELTHA